MEFPVLHSDSAPTCENPIDINGVSSSFFSVLFITLFALARTIPPATARNTSPTAATTLVQFFLQFPVSLIKKVLL